MGDMQEPVREEQVYRKEPDPAVWLDLAKGFNRLTLGIPLTLLLFVGILNINLPGNLSLPPYVFGVALILWGCVRLGRVRGLTPRWERRLRQATVACCLHLYFAPFVLWWTRMPYQTLLTLNMLALMACMAWMLLLANQLSFEVATHLEDTNFQAESRLWGWAVVILMLIPMQLFFAYAVRMSLRYETNLYLEMTQLLEQHIPSWTQAAFLLPFSLTVVTLWKTRERCLAQLLKQSVGHTH